MKQTNLEFGNPLAEQQMMIRNETLKKVEKYLYLEKKIATNRAYEKEIRTIIWIGWNSYVNNSNILGTMKTICLPLKRWMPSKHMLTIMACGLYVTRTYSLTESEN